MKSLISTNNANSKSSNTTFETEKNTKIKEYSIFLFHLLDILDLLLANLLSSHVDNYRDNFVLDSIINLFVTLINHLQTVYTVDKNTSNGLHVDLNYSYSLSNVYYLQILFTKVLFCFRQICKFNTTIKLNFNKIMEKIVENPSYKGPLIFVLNFMFQVVNNEYTIINFLELIKKQQKIPVQDIYSELESTYEHQQFVKIGHLANDLSLIEYIMEIGINSNSSWISDNCASLLIGIQKNYSSKDNKVYEEICDYLNNILSNNFNRIAKVNMSILESKVKNIILYNYK